MKLLLKYDKWIILGIFVFSFLINDLIACLFLLISLGIVVLYEKKLIKPFINIGFLIFLSVTVLIPTFIYPAKIIDNALIVLRGIFFLFTLHFLLRNMESSKTYRYFQKILPDELKVIIKISLKLFPKIKTIFIDTWNDVAKKKKLSITPLIYLFDNIIRLADELETEITTIKLRKIYIITGDVHEGKSSFAYKIANKLQKRNLKVGGIISKSVNKDDMRVGYDVIDLKSGKTVPLATINNLDNYSDVCGRFYFYKNGMDFALNSLNLDYLEDTDIVFVDEIGMLELNEKGFYKSILQLLDSNIHILVLVVRNKYIDSVKTKFNLENLSIIRI